MITAIPLRNQSESTTQQSPMVHQEFVKRPIIGTPFRVYTHKECLMNGLRSKSIHESGEKILFLPHIYETQDISKITYVMSGYFPNLVNIRFLTDLTGIHGGTVEIRFCFKGSSNYYSDDEHIDRMRRMMPFDNLEFTVCDGEKPLERVLDHGNADVMVIPYMDLGMFEMDDISLTMIEDVMDRAHIPIMIF